MAFDYYILDVFTGTPLAGNPLAVVLGADALTTDAMQALAGEFNLSETVFVRQAAGTGNHASLRIFTPQRELPFAGHPTVGSAVLLGLKRAADELRLEEKVGLVTCAIEKTGESTGRAKFGLPRLPQGAGAGPGNADAANALGLAASDIGFGAFKSVTHYSAGVDFYLVPVADAEALRRIQLDLKDWNSVFPAGHNAVYVFTETPAETGNDLAARMFSPGMGIAEDPATGAAASALIGLLADHDPQGHGIRTYRLRQGHEMGRPSLIELEFGLQNGRLTHGAIGGSAVIIAEGRLHVPA